MLNLFGKIPNIGTLYYDEIFVFYDEPQIFSCVSMSFQKYFAILIDSYEGIREWILTPISKAKLIKAKHNAIQIRSIFTEPEADIIWKIRLSDQYLVEQIDASQLTDEMLPLKGECLDFEYEDDCLSTSKETAQTISINEHRDVIEISLERDNDHIREVDCSLLSSILDTTQELLYALANKDGGIKGQIPKTIKRNCSIQVAGTFAASFGIRLKSDELCAINFETPLTPTLNELNTLLSISDKKDELIKFLSTQNPRVALKYRKLIKALINSNVGVKFSNASPNKKAFSRHFATHELISNLGLIESEIKKMIETKVYIGKLVGVNTEKKTFVFITVDDENIKGNLSDQLSESVFEVPQEAEIQVEQKIDMDSFTQEEKYAYKLLSLSSVIPASNI